MSGRRDGFALATVLWVVVGMAAAAALALGRADLDLRASENRILARRARWAALACLDVARARFAGDGAAADLGSARAPVDNGGAPAAVDLGRGTTCSTTPLDATVRIHLARVDSLGLARALADEALAAAVLDWRDADDVPRTGGAEAAWYRARGRPPPANAPFAEAAELGWVRGFEDVPADALEALFTTRGDGRVDPNRAPVEVLATLSELPEGSAEAIDRVRSLGGRLDDAEEVMRAAGARLSTERFRSLARHLTFDDTRRDLRVDAVARSGPREVAVKLVATLRLEDGRAVVERLEVGG